MSQHKTLSKALAVAAVTALTLSACGSSEIDQQTNANVSQSESQKVSTGGTCGDLNLAVNPWVGFEADAYVVGTLAADKLGCNVQYKDLKEEVSWQGFSNNEVDVVMEDWGHPDLEQQYFAKSGDGSAEPLGPTGNIGWYVPPWMADKYPDITNWKNLNKYASLFETPESDGKGQFLGSDPSYVQFDESIVSNLGLNFKVVFSGSEAASIAAFRKAEQNKEPLIGYFYEPQWFMSEVPLVKVNLPDFTEGCQDVAADVSCDYPKTVLQKVVSTDWAKSGDTSVDLVKNFKWTNTDQNLVAKYIAEDGMKPEDAAAKWIKENPDKVAAWMPQG